MSVAHSLLAMLADHPTHGYRLKAEFERCTGGAWPLNIGQVYTTLARLERDGLIEAARGDDEQKAWRLTTAGRDALAAWYTAPVVDEPPARDELAIKVLIAAATGNEDVTAILQRQREATMARLQRLTRQKVQADPRRELPWLLVLEALVLAADAELRWLERCEARLAAAKEDP
jgi:DNA-binding PadR family transcriptional regulator